ncbi:hypothetical protein CMEL01_00212 [Colletotrichum melonis]|uniref:Uncharacterized protein n=1 Tax=Colletotrichum melonis TaxID=1209925 RepID=A0AAI9V1C5_9PEZI|nr:hypothetical protein CMEL01_00212 [Colletotrichum melonis]
MLTYWWCQQRNRGPPFPSWQLLLAATFFSQSLFFYSPTPFIALFDSKNNCDAVDAHSRQMRTHPMTLTGERGNPNSVKAEYEPRV